VLRARLVDVGLAAGFVVAGQVEARVRTTDGYAAGGAAFNTVVLLLGDAALVLWRVSPRAALLTMTGVFAVASVLGPHDEFFWTSLLPLVLVTYQVARHDDGPLGTWGWLVGTAGGYADALHVAALRDPTNLATSVVLLGGATVVGRLLHRQQRQREALDATLAELAVEQERRERLAALAERHRIAAETHDVVAQAVSQMVVQLGAARVGLEARDQPVPEQLSAAEATGRTALAELRRSLGVLAERPERDLAPAPGLADVEPLAARFREAGLDVRLDVDLAPADPLPPGLQLAVHRVLQEALTNALKHAGPVRVDVRLHRADGLLVLDVSDDGGPGSGPLPAGGHGLVGMRERVAFHGGSLEAGPRGRTGWRVHAAWPVP
jgi:signal transduction histidine kinase